MEPLTEIEFDRLLRASTGVDDGGLPATRLDVPFDDLGYDSVALLETIGAVERRHGVRLTDDLIGRAETPRALLTLINDEFAKVGAVGGAGAGASATGPLSPGRPG